MNGYLYVNDSLELVQLGESTALEDAQAEVAAYAEDAQLKQSVVTGAHSLTATMNQARAGLQSQLDKNRAEVDRFRKEKTEDALINYTTTDHAANADAYGRLAQGISWLTLALTTCDAVAMPAQLLSQQRTEIALLEAMGNLFAARAIQASVERFAASKDLLATDSVVSFGPSGRAYDLLKTSWEWHRRSSEADKKLHIETQRLAMIQAAEKGTL